MLKCPGCRQILTKTSAGFGVMWQCSSCEGRAVTLSLLRKGVESDFLNVVWQEAREFSAGGHRGPRDCPACSQRMPQAHVPAPDASQLTLDVCLTCHFIWLDAGEAALLPHKPITSVAPKPELSSEAREAVALAKIEALRRNHEREDKIRDFASGLLGSSSLGTDPLTLVLSWLLRR